MNKKCKNCGSNDLPIVANKLCQGCLSENIERRKIDSGSIFLFNSTFLIDEYLINGNSMRKIAKDNQTTLSIVRRHLETFRIPIRDQKQALRKKLDENIFKNMTAQGAYLLGYIYTDGDFLFNESTKKKFLRIYSKHKEQIEKIRSILKSDAKIQYREQKNYGGVVQGEIYFLHIGSPSIISDLLDFGLTIHKNVNVRFPDIPDNLKHHFIRGCWTGSGSVSIYKTSVISSIIIGSYDFMVEIEKFLNKKGLKKRNIHKLGQSKKPSYMIKYAHSESDKLYSFLYRGKTNLTVSDKQENIYKTYFKRQGCNQNS